ncbi:AAA family ATPase [Konateibacter massiliensis]|uniref:AAA family ATPase n=1 Tax=Konateibacter massiliensis TaxID=2002841 RepID=UPI000C1513A7|nr:AAA family ATPase [Konateibacter massiliensis]
MENKWILSPNRQLTEEEKSLVWEKPASHIESDAEQRICESVKHNWERSELKITNVLLEGDAGSGKTQLAKALSADFGLPYTKVTCFADMDKSDILGAILPVLQSEQGDGSIEYKYYPSEIVRAYENGWLLEIQEPTVIRDAAVLMALNSALEPDGSINLPNRIVHRHPDFIAVITTNRGYNGCRPLNEALRDRVQHAEKMDLPPIEIMVERAAAKTGCCDAELLRTFAQVIVILDQTAKANAIKGVSGMRSYFFWVDAVLHGNDAEKSLYYKVIYKITTDPDEIALLEQAMSRHGMLEALEEVVFQHRKTNGEVLELRADGDFEVLSHTPDKESVPGVALRKSPDSEGKSSGSSENTINTQGLDTCDDGSPMYHELQPKEQEKLAEEKSAYRKHLNQQAREAVKGSSHEKIGMIVHQPESTPAHRQEYCQIASTLMPVIRELTRKTEPLLEHELSVEFANNRVFGTKFHAEQIASPDFRYFSKKRPPEKEPSLAVALRIDQSASMNAFGRLEAAKQAAVAVYEFCASCGIPVLIYGDTADRSPKEKMSLYSYIDWEEPRLNDKYSLMAIQSISNNRDGMALRILAEKLVNTPQTTKLLISLSDGQPKAIPDYTGDGAMDDMKQVIRDYSRKGVLFLAAAIGQDKETICDIYGQERFIDITNLEQLPTRLVQIIAKYL